MTTKRESNVDSDITAMNGREEMILFLFRDLSAHQQRELISEMRALCDANRITRDKMHVRQFHPTSNEAVKAAFKDVPPPATARRIRKRPKKPPGRPPGAPLDDFLGDE